MRKGLMQSRNHIIFTKFIKNICIVQNFKKFIEKFNVLSTCSYKFIKICIVEEMYSIVILFPKICT